MTPNPADASDVETRGYVLPEGVTGLTVQARLDEAWRALHFEDGLRGLDATIAAGLVDVDLVIDIVWAAALRILRNPEGSADQAASLDDYSESSKRSDPTMDLYFTAAELRRLRPDSPVGAQFAGSFKYS